MPFWWFRATSHGHSWVFCPCQGGLWAIPRPLWARFSKGDAQAGQGALFAWRLHVPPRRAAPSPRPRRRHSHRRPISADRLFDALDGRTIEAGTRSWSTEVYSIMEGRGARWVQLALLGTSRHMLALRLARTDDAGFALGALSTWLRASMNPRDVAMASPPQVFSGLTPPESPEWAM